MVQERKLRKGRLLGNNVRTEDEGPEEEVIFMLLARSGDMTGSCGSHLRGTVPLTEGHLGAF